MMIRALISTALFFVSAAAGQEVSYVHRAAGKDVARTTTTRTERSFRAEGSDGAGAARLSASVEYGQDGRVLAYERELRGAGGALVGRVSVSAIDAGARVRETGPFGSRTRTAPGGAFDVVADPSFPEGLVPILEDRDRTSFRALIVSEAEVRTVLIERRGDGARYVEIPGGGVTVRYDARGVSSLALPGAEPREILREGAAPVVVAPNPDDGVDERFVRDAAEGVRLGGALRRPPTPTPPRALAILVGDAGPIDRDGLGGGRHVPTLRLLARELARRGIATVRADKRGAGESVGPAAGLDELAEDAAALLAYGLDATGLPATKAFYIGHGEGAVVVVEAAASRPTSVAGVATLAGPGRALGEALESRLKARLAASGESPEAIERGLASLREEIARLKDAPRASVAPSSLLLADLSKIDPAARLSRVKVPVLVLHGAEDPEVPPQHVSLLRAALAFSERRVRFQMIDRADHDLTMAPEGSSAVRSPPGSADTARDLHPSVAALIADFVKSLE